MSTVPHVEVAEVVTLTKNIDAAVLRILSMLEGHAVVQDLAPDLAEIASASQYVRGVAEDALKHDDERGPAGDHNEPAHRNVNGGADDPVALARTMQQKRHGASP